MKILLTIIFLLFTTFLFAQQNLVPNPSFEDYYSCPTDMPQFYNVDKWVDFTSNSDYYNSCASQSSYASVPDNGAGYQEPFNINCHAYAGIYAYFSPIKNNRDYIGCELLDSLIIGERYFALMKVSLANIANCGINKLGIKFSTSPHYYGEPYNVNPPNYAQVYSSNIIMDTTNWVTIFGSFIADSSYKYLTIGNFFTDSLTDTLIFSYSGCTSYYYIDNICVSIDSSYCYNYSYNCGEGINAYSKSNIKIFPDPAINELTIDYSLTEKSYFELFDILGAKRKTVTLDCGSQTKRMDLTDIDNGLYFYSVVDMNGNRIKTGKLIVIK
jgi:hypothetical protein